MMVRTRGDEGMVMIVRTRGDEWMEEGTGLLGMMCCEEVSCKRLWGMYCMR